MAAAATLGRTANANAFYDNIARGHASTLTNSIVTAAVGDLGVVGRRRSGEGGALTE